MIEWTRIRRFLLTLSYKNISPEASTVMTDTWGHWSFGSTATKELCSSQGKVFSSSVLKAYNSKSFMVLRSWEHPLLKSVFFFACKTFLNFVMMSLAGQCIRLNYVDGASSSSLSPKKLRVRKIVLTQKCLEWPPALFSIWKSYNAQSEFLSTADSDRCLGRSNRPLISCSHRSLQIIDLGASLLPFRRSMQSAYVH